MAGVLRVGERVARQEATVRFLAFSDLHFSTEPPVGRSESYPERLLHKLEVVREVGEERKVEAYLFGGDATHRRQHTTHRDVQVLMAALQRFGKPIYSVWGNHDATSEEQMRYRAYGCLLEAGVLEDVATIPREPGQAVLGDGYRDGVDEPGSGYYAPPNPCIVWLVHGMLMLESGDRPFQCTDVGSIEAQQAQVVVCGHYHTPQEPREVGGCWYVCPGGLGRYSRVEKDRDICVAVIEVRGDKVKVDQFSIKDRIGVSDDDWLPEDRALVSMDEVRGVAEGLVLGAGDAGADAGAAVEAAAAELGMGPEVVHEARRFLEEAGA